MEERKRVREENPGGGYGWFNFGKPAQRQEGEQQAGAWGLPGFAKGWWASEDKDGAPSGFYEK